MKLPRRIRELAIGITMLLAPSAGRSQSPVTVIPTPSSNCHTFGLVTEWKGTLRLSGSGSGPTADGGSYSVNETITATPDTATPQGPGVLTGTMNETIHIDDLLTHGDGTFEHVTDDETLKIGPVSMQGGIQGAGMSVDLAGCTNFEFDFDPTFNGTFTDQNGSTASIGAYGPVGPSSIIAPLPSAGMLLSGSSSLPGFSQLIGAPMTWTMNWLFTPAFDLDVLVTIPQYSTWRPTGGNTENDTGVDASGRPNLLTIEALLVNKNTQQPWDFPPDQMTFSLVNGSKEPGVAMNWPPQSQLISSAPPDLSFDSNQLVNETLNLIPFTISPDGTQAVIAPIIPPNLEPVTIVLSPHDWGGWATLQVTATATLADLTFSGHLQDSPTENPNIPLPKSQPGSHIADVWKTMHNVPLSTPDSDDSESSADNNPNQGDGLTLYEEYRGFYTRCPKFVAVPGSGCTAGLTHIEGDPKKKDLFVVNRQGPDVVAGINWFKKGTGLNVQLLGADQITVDHIVNFNHSQGAHNADQHAVVIAKGNPGTQPCTLNGPGQPKDIKQIYIPPLANFLANAKQQGGNARLQWAQQTYPASVAHELAHSVFVWHHGNTDTQWVIWTPLPDGTIDELVKSTLQSTKIRVFLENGTELTGRSLTISPGQAMTLWQGVNGGFHSGDVFCFMRYDISQSYKSNADPTIRYYVPEGESPGSYLTDIVQGTGTNLSTRTTPQSRYNDVFDANRGDCSKQLCVNDKLSPTARGLQGGTCPGN